MGHTSFWEGKYSFVLLSYSIQTWNQTLTLICICSHIICFFSCFLNVKGFQMWWPLPKIQRQLFIFMFKTFLYCVSIVSVVLKWQHIVPKIKKSHLFVIELKWQQIVKISSGKMTLYDTAFLLENYFFTSIQIYLYNTMILF